MAFSKSVVWGKIVITEDRTVVLNRAVVGYEDGVEFARRENRVVVAPDDEIPTALPNRIKNLITAVRNW